MFKALPAFLLVPVFTLISATAYAACDVTSAQADAVARALVKLAAAESTRSARAPESIIPDFSDAIGRKSLIGVLTLQNERVFDAEIASMNGASTVSAMLQCDAASGNWVALDLAYGNGGIHTVVGRRFALEL